MELEYQDLVIKTEFLKTSKQRIKKDIEFYKAAINKLVSLLSSRPSSTTSPLSDLALHHYRTISARLSLVWLGRFFK